MCTLKSKAVVVPNLLPNMLTLNHDFLLKLSLPILLPYLDLSLPILFACTILSYLILSYLRYIIYVGTSTCLYTTCCLTLLCYLIHLYINYLSYTIYIFFGILQIWELIHPWIENQPDGKRNEEKGLQKKAYQFLQAVCNADSPGSRAWMERNFGTLAKLLGSRKTSPVAPAQSFRLQTMEGLMTLIKDGKVDWAAEETRKLLESMFDEVVNSLSGHYNVKTRRAAAKCLIKLMNVSWQELKCLP